MTEAEELELLEMELELASKKPSSKPAAMTPAEYMAKAKSLPNEYGEEAPFMAQVGRGMKDVYQGTGQLVRNVAQAAGIGDATESNQKLKEELDLYNKYNPDIQPARILGNIVTPASLVPGMAGRNLLMKGLYTLGTGAGFGATQPVTDEDFWKSKGEQAALGAVVAPVAPLAVKGMQLAGQGIKHTIRPLSDKGITKDLAELFRKEAGGEESVKKIVDALQSRKTYVPGNEPTVGMAIADAARSSGDDFGASLVRIEKELAKEGPQGEVLRAQLAKQAQNRASAIGQIAGTKDDMARAIKARATRTAPLYAAVEESTQQVNTIPVTSMIDDILAKNPNETSITTPLTSLKKKIEEGTNTPQALYSLSKEIKAMMGRTTPGGQKEYNVKVLAGIKEALDSEIGKAERAFDIAQRAYKAKSAPINRMEVGRELQEGLVKSADLASPTEAPVPFLAAMRDAPRTLKRATGFNRYDELGDVLKPEQVSSVKNVAEELLRQQQQSKMAGSVRPMLNQLDTGIEPRLPRILERNVVIANYALKKLGADKSPEYHRIAIDLLQNPDKMLAILKSPEESVAKNIARSVLEASSEIASTATVAVPSQTTARMAGE